MMAVPVLRGQWRTITLGDGTQVKVEAVGDEWCHFWRSATGNAYIEKNNVYVKTDVHKLQEAAEVKRTEVNAHRAARFEKYFGNQYGTISNGKRKAIGGFKQLTGVHKGLVLLVEFNDFHFLPEHTSDFYRRVLNDGGVMHADLAERGYGESVKQYFYDQSNDKFSVDFDVAPIIRMPKNHDSYTNDMRGIIRYAINELKQDPSYDWAQYDWDNDGEIDMVFVLYAGYGQATKTDDLTLIWPHESTIGYSKPNAGGKVFNTYACANEINWNFGEGDLDSGIGTFCHEFAHCLGYPDLYDICSNSGPGCNLTSMNYWDLLDSGSYNGGGFCSAPFSIYEKMTAGWITPAELEVDKEYNNLRPITDKDGGDVLVMTNPNNKNEFYAFEPIQNRSWATGFYGAKGLRILHIDYNANIWSYNLVNCAQYPNYNKRSRYTYIPADGSYVCEKTSQIKGDLYPYKGVREFAGEWSAGDQNGDKKCSIKLTDITLNEDNTVSFKTVLNEGTPNERPEGAVFYESFNKCIGTGGNDNIWRSNETDDLITDNVWTTTAGKGANKCAMFGTNTQVGIATTENIIIEPGEYIVKFKVGSYNTETGSITLGDPSNDNTFFEHTTFNVESDKWNECETYMKTDGNLSLRFRGPARKRWFLDEISIVKDGSSTGIQEITNAKATAKTPSFNLQGQKVDGGYRGIVIRNKKKFIK